MVPAIALIRHMPLPEPRLLDGRNPATCIAAVLDDPATSRWLKSALGGALDRDAVDAVNDAEVLVELLTARASAIIDAQLDALATASPAGN